MSLKSHPQWLPQHLERTYQALVKFSHNGRVTGTYRDLMTELTLLSPAPLIKRLDALAKHGVIQFG
jgi:DNA-binding HxlR family transcriptional regulator